MFIIEIEIKKKKKKKKKKKQCFGQEWYLDE